MQEKRKPLTRSERGRIGAAALNSDPEKKRAAALKGAQTRKTKDPDVFKKMGAIKKKEDKHALGLSSN